jgi:hypothetical protein
MQDQNERRQHGPDQGQMPNRNRTSVQDVPERDVDNHPGFEEPERDRATQSDGLKLPPDETPVEQDEPPAPEGDKGHVS